MMLTVFSFFPNSFLQRQSGQSCLSCLQVERLVKHRSLYDFFFLFITRSISLCLSVSSVKHTEETAECWTHLNRWSHAVYPASCCTLISDTKCGLCSFHEDWPMKVYLEAWWHLMSSNSLNYSKTHSISVLNSDRGKWGQRTPVASWFGSVLSGLSFCLHGLQLLSG